MTLMPRPTGPFTCAIALRRIRAPEFVREDKDGVTYMVARGYEIAYETIRSCAAACGWLTNKLELTKHHRQGQVSAWVAHVMSLAPVAKLTLCATTLDKIRQSI